MRRSGREGEGVLHRIACVVVASAVQRVLNDDMAQRKRTTAQNSKLAQRSDSPKLQ